MIQPQINFANVLQDLTLFLLGIPKDFLVDKLGSPQNDIL